SLNPCRVQSSGSCGGLALTYPFAGGPSWGKAVRSNGLPQLPGASGAGEALARVNAALVAARNGRRGSVCPAARPGSGTDQYQAKETLPSHSTTPSSSWRVG